MDLATIANELYGLSPQEFTTARNARAAEARKGGDEALAASLKGLRKPSTGAWLANQLVREQSRDIEHLIELGTPLRSARALQGAEIRRVTKEKAETVARLLRQARSLAKRADQPLSQSTEQELEATLDAAFSDRESAQSLIEGRLTTALHYSGLGFGPDAKARDRGATPKVSGRLEGGSTSAGTALAKRALKQALKEAEQANSEAEKAEQRVRAAEADLKRLKAASSVARRQAVKAHANAAAAQKKLERRDQSRTHNS